MDDNHIYVVYRTYDDKYYIEDLINQITYEFQNYQEIIDTCPGSDRFLFGTRRHGMRPSSCKEKVDIFKRLVDISSLEIEKLNKGKSYYKWISNIDKEGSNYFDKLNKNFLKDIQNQMGW
jgi:hypothetical protein